MRVRKTARVLLFNSNNKVLLQCVSPLEPLKMGVEKIWITPGGKIESNESVQECAERELYEETGIECCEFGSIIWHGSQILRLDGEDTIFEETFIVATTHSDNIPKNGDDITILEHKWWSLEELLETKEIVFPSNLSALIKKVITKTDAI